MQSLIVFNSKDVRGEIVDNEPWFALMDVCQVLGIRDVKQAGERLKDKYKRNILLSNKGRGKQSVVCINKIGCYRLIMRSSSPAAEAFQDEIYEYVIPAYVDKGAVVNPRATAEQLEAHKHDIAELQARLAALENKGATKTYKKYSTPQYLKHIALEVPLEDERFIDSTAYAICKRDSIGTGLTGKPWHMYDTYPEHICEQAVSMWRDHR